MGSRWYYRLPGEFYANGPTVNTYPNERAARKAIREMYNLPRLPRGFEVWRAN